MDMRENWIVITGASSGIGKAIVYAFAEDDLERLTGAQKHLLRMGSSNAARVQAKLAELHQAFGWTEPASMAVTAENEAHSGFEAEIVKIAEALEPTPPVEPTEERAGREEVAMRPGDSYPPTTPPLPP